AHHPPAPDPWRVAHGGERGRPRSRHPRDEPLKARWGRAAAAPRRRCPSPAAPGRPEAEVEGRGRAPEGGLRPAGAPGTARGTLSAMGIFDRMSRVISSNFNALLDKADDPKKSIELLLEEMAAQVKAGRQEVVRAVAAEKQLRHKVEEL